MKVRTTVTLAVTIEHEESDANLPGVVFNTAQGARDAVDAATGFHTTDVKVIAIRTDVAGGGTA